VHLIGAAELTAILRRGRYHIGREAFLQQSIAGVLEAAGVAFESEVRLGPANRIDFLAAGGIGIEAKVRYPKRAIYRQLQRYAEVEQITALILVTATALGVPPAINGKPIFYVSIGRTAL
jgi:hypothetical protein